MHVREHLIFGLLPLFLFFGSFILCLLHFDFWQMGFLFLFIMHGLSNDLQNTGYLGQKVLDQIISLVWIGMVIFNWYIYINISMSSFTLYYFVMFSLLEQNNFLNTWKWAIFVCAVVLGCCSSAYPCGVILSRCSTCGSFYAKFHITLLGISKIYLNNQKVVVVFGGYAYLYNV